MEYKNIIQFPEYIGYYQGVLVWPAKERGKNKAQWWYFWNTEGFYQFTYFSEVMKICNVPEDEAIMMKLRYGM